MENKLEHLKEYLKGLGSVAVAFSSGVDSTFLLKVAHDVLGDKAIAITAQSCSFPKRELNEAKAFCEKEGIQHVICQSEELEIEGFSKNPPIAVKELGVKSPLCEAKLTKAEIREYSKELGLPTWDKQSFACLSSRFVYGETISEEKLGMVEKAEQLLLDYGFHQVRVRIHGSLARIEIMPEEFPKLLEKNVREDIAKKFKEYGFTYVTMDILGYRMGSMNETLGENDKMTADSSLKGKNE